MPKPSCVLCHTTWTKEKVKFVHVPKDEVKRKNWVKSCSTSLKPGEKVCMYHFSAKDFEIGPDRKRAKLNSDALPMPIEILHCWNEPETAPHLVDASTQTESFTDFRVSQLEKELAHLKERLVKLDEFKSNVSQILSEGQIKKLEDPTKTIHWAWDDMAQAISLHSAGRKAYNYLYNKGLPLPCESTVSKWLQKLKFEDGILSFSLSMMRSVNDAPLEDRLCIISFDEMRVESVFEYDSLTDTVRKPCKNVQVMIVRGLRSSWKQPIFCDYDCKVSKSILEKAISKLYDVGYTVVGIVSDMGSANQALWKDLNISCDQTWFAHPATDGKVFVFADVPHLLKLLRNHFIDTGYLYKGTLLTARPIAQILAYTSLSDARITHKLTELHLTVHHSGRQKVKLAAQLFSHTTASAIRRCYALGLDMYQPMETAEFIDTVNDWFDIFNTKFSNFQTAAAKKPYGMDLGQQDEIISKMDALNDETRAYGRISMLPFQRGIQLSNKSLRDLYRYVQEKYCFQYILTYRLNQDVLEHFFGAMRAKGGLYDNPSPMEFKYRLRRYLLARNTSILVDRGNVEADETNWLRLNDTSLETLQSLLTEDEIVSDDSLFANDSLNEDADFDSLHEDALEYIAGYIIRKLKLTDCSCNEPTFTWVDTLSKGGLVKPSTEFLDKIKMLESAFNQFNGRELYGGISFLQKLFTLSENVSLRDDVKRFFFKCRMHFRIKHLNRCNKQKKRTMSIR